MHRIEPHPIEHTLTFKVPFFDVDPMLIVWHGNYFKYLEVARAALLEKYGCGYATMAQCGLQFPIVDVKLSYRRSLHLDDVAAVRAYLLECENRLKVGYEISHDGILCAYGYTVQAAVDAQSHELLLQIPEVIQRCFQGELCQ
ncbi:MAG: acyl-CoA thioesterase [Candidatus Anaerobiospirillum merdipullorum]|uniref:Acyl-CoA thioesterase n=1 Tax=Candidatus Anaerobiospirillum merdipullorum TaxID=2838450 RepID=A0A9E2NS39_9GAMM|nr:acyl-CoA thioesterase [Candidatus Anaerobiospirillum merdipullorum]